MSKICTKCGNVLSDDAKFCARCGKSLSTEMNKQAGQQMAKPQMNPVRNQQNINRQQPVTGGTNPSRQQSVNSNWSAQGNQNMNQQWNNQGQGMNQQWNNQGQGMNQQWNNQGQDMNQQWNNQGQGMNQQWNNKGAGVQSLKTGFSNMKNAVMRQAQKLSSGNKKAPVLIGIGVVALLIILIVAIVGAGKPSNSRLKKQLPIDVLTYEYEGETRTSKVKSLKVEKRMSSKGYDTAYCKIKLEDEFMTRIVYLEINSQKYTQGGWNITYYRLYRSDEVYGRGEAEKYVDDMLDELAKNDEITILNVSKTKNEDGSFTCEVEEDSEDYSGTERVTIKLINMSEEQEDSLDEVDFPMEYGWTVTDFDTSQIKAKN